MPTCVCTRSEQDAVRESESNELLSAEAVWQSCSLLQTPQRCTTETRHVALMNPPHQCRKLLAAVDGF